MIRPYEFDNAVDMIGHNNVSGRMVLGRIMIRPYEFDNAVDMIGYNNVSGWMVLGRIMIRPYCTPPTPQPLKKGKMFQNNL